MRGKGNRLSETTAAELERAYRNGATVEQLCERFDLNERAVYKRTQQIRRSRQIRNNARKTCSAPQLCLVAGCYIEVPRGVKFCDRHAPAPTTNPALMGAR